MEFESVKRSIKAIKKGAFTRVVFERPIEPLSKFKTTKITKHVERTARIGIDYSNMAAVIESRAEAQPNAYVKTWNWEPGYELYIKRTIKTGQLLLSFKTVANPNEKVVYTIDGVPATEEQVRAITPSKVWTHSRGTETFDVKIENLISIGGAADDDN